MSVKEQSEGELESWGLVRFYASNTINNHPRRIGCATEDRVGFENGVSVELVKETKVEGG